MLQKSCKVVCRAAHNSERWNSLNRWLRRSQGSISCWCHELPKCLLKSLKRLPGGNLQFQFLRTFYPQCVICLQDLQVKVTSCSRKAQGEQQACPFGPSRSGHLQSTEQFLPGWSCSKQNDTFYRTVPRVVLPMSGWWPASPRGPSAVQSLGCPCPRWRGRRHRTQSLPSVHAATEWLSFWPAMLIFSFFWVELPIITEWQRVLIPLPQEPEQSTHFLYNKWAGRRNHLSPPCPPHPLKVQTPRRTALGPWSAGHCASVGRGTRCTW